MTLPSHQTVPLNLKTAPRRLFYKYLRHIKLWVLLLLVYLLEFSESPNLMPVNYVVRILQFNF